MIFSASRNQVAASLNVKRVLITGAGGFCGAHLCRHLRKLGFEVTGTYHRTMRKEGAEGVRYSRLDVTDESAVNALIQRIRPHFVCHLAAQSIPLLSWKRPAATFQTNVVGTLRILNALRRYAPTARLLYASSIQVYGRAFRSGKAASEDALLWPENPYAVSKVLAEYACHEFAKKFGLRVVVVRPFNHVGTGQSLHFVFSDWCRQVALAEKGRRPAVLKVGNLEARRDFLHVADVVRAYELLLRKGRTGSCYNICTGRTRPLTDYTRFLMRRSTISLALQVQEKRMRRFDPPVMKGSAQRLRKLGWRPLHSPFAGLQAILDEWRLKVR